MIYVGDINLTSHKYNNSLYSFERFRIELFVWCSTGYTGKRCEENCKSDEPNCNYEKCIQNGMTVLIML